jgi:hypothetical protein
VVVVGRLKLDSSACFDAAIEVVFDLPHFGYDVSKLDEFLWGVSSGENEFHVGWSALDQFNGSLQGDEVSMDTVINFVDDDEVVVG